MESRRASAESCEKKIALDSGSEPVWSTSEVNHWRLQFPALSQNEHRCFFNNAATSQLPTSVLTAVENYYTDGASSPGRGGGVDQVHTGRFIQGARERIAEFLGVAEPGGIVFTSGATESMNLVCQSWALRNLEDGDEILYSSHDHDSLTAPWFKVQELLKERGISIVLKEYALFPHSGDPRMDDILEQISPRTRVLSMSHIHHVYGLDAELEKLEGKLPERVRVVLDIAQSVGHIELDIDAMPVDFAFFSGHKMFSMNGVGVLWVKPRCWNELHPFASGSLALQKSESVPRTAHAALEFGTPNVSGIVSLDAAVAFLREVGLKNIEKYLQQLTVRLIEGLKTIPQIEFLPGPAYLSCPLAFGIVSFRLLDLSGSDLGLLLDEAGISVRAGAHCSGITGSNADSVRVSLHFYNTFDEVERFLEAMQEICDHMV